MSSEAIMLRTEPPPPPQKMQALFAQKTLPVHIEIS